MHIENTRLGSFKAFTIGWKWGWPHLSIGDCDYGSIVLFWPPCWFAWYRPNWSPESKWPFRSEKGES